MGEAAVIGALDEVAEHRLGDLEVGDHAVLERPHRVDRRRRAPEHLLGLGADGVDLAGAVSTATTEGSERTMPRPRT